MCNLVENDLKRKIIVCGDEPANFNHICNSLGGNVVSIDPIYSLSKKQIEARIKQTFSNVIDQIRKNLEMFRWNKIKSVDEPGKIRMDAMNKFLATCEQDKKHGRYIDSSLLKINFPNDSFDIALSSHFLFLYYDNLYYKFHYLAICEILRIASEVHIFPILDVNSKRSLYVDAVLKDLKEYQCKISRVNYDFQVNRNEMLRIVKKIVHFYR